MRDPSMGEVSSVGNIRTEMCSKFIGQMHPYQIHSTPRYVDMLTYQQGAHGMNQRSDRPQRACATGLTAELPMSFRSVPLDLRLRDRIC